MQSPKSDTATATEPLVDGQPINRPAHKGGGELFIVDNSDELWKGLKYLHDWTEIASV